MATTIIAVMMPTIGAIMPPTRLCMRQHDGKGIWLYGEALSRTDI
jgi:hypothetical protein